jgi:hypothetical protein
VALVQDFLVQFIFIFPRMQQGIAQFWHGQHFGEGQEETKCVTQQIADEAKGRSDDARCF